MIGRTISHYRVVEKLGEGAIGIVYKAEDIKLRRPVALKFLSPEALRNDEERRRFVHEAQAAALLDHPNICAVYDIDEAEGQAFIAMAYIDGPTVAQRIKERPLPLGETLDITIQSGRGLQEAHEKGIVHRDVKSANILLTSKGQAKLADFGLAHLAGRTKITKTGTTLGTPAYMSPEQAQGQKTDCRTDIWSLGIVLYETATGRLPFEGDYHQAVIYSIINEEVEPVTSLRSGVPTELDRIIFKSLAKSPEERYQHADEMLVDLRVLQSQVSSDSAKKLRSRSSRGSRVPRQPTGNIAQPRRLLARAATGAVALLLAIWLLVPSLGPVIQDWFFGPAIPQQKRLVVLPFKTPDADPQRQALVNGIVEVLTSELTQLERFHDALLVVPSSEVLERGTESPSQAHRDFRATLAVTGTLLGTRQDLRLVVNLVDVQEMRQVASAVIKGNVDALPKLENQTTAKLAGFLGVRLLPRQLAELRGPVSHAPGAYEFYLQGSGYVQRYRETVKNIDTAIQLFRKALERDPDYALAYAGLGKAYWRKHRYHKDKQWAELALEYCSRAAELNDQLPDVHLALGLVYAGTAQYEKAIKTFSRALEFDSRSTTAYQGLARPIALWAALKRRKRPSKRPSRSGRTIGMATTS